MYLSVGCFGKLPCYGDYLEGALVSPTARSLKEWILGWYHSSDDRPPHETTSRRFLLGLSGSVELLAGVIRPSADGQSRRFPFVVFSQFPRRAFGKHYALLPMALAPVWDALDEAWESLATVPTRGAFVEVLGATKVPEPLPVEETRRDYENRLADSSGRLFHAEKGDSVAHLRRNLPEVITRIRGGGEKALTAELPVSAGGAEAGFDAGFWIDLVNHQFRWRRFEPGVFLAPEGAQPGGNVLLIYGSLSPSDYPAVMGCEEAVVDICRPTRAPADVPAPDPPAQPEDSPVLGQLLKGRFGAAA